jgi:hypothetical protein
MQHAEFFMLERQHRERRSYLLRFKDSCFSSNTFEKWFFVLVATSYFNFWPPWSKWLQHRPNQLC